MYFFNRSWGIGSTEEVVFRECYNRQTVVVRSKKVNDGQMEDVDISDQGLVVSVQCCTTVQTDIVKQRS